MTIILALFFHLLRAQMGYDNMDPAMLQAMGMGGDGPKPFAPNSKWIKYIQCEVCKETTKQMWRQSIKKKKSQNGKIGEEELLDLTESICDPFSEEGEWISYFDLVRKDDKLKMVDKKEPGRCRRECETIAKSCSVIMRENDITFSEQIYMGNVKRAALEKKVCYKGSKKFCGKKPHKVPQKSKAGKERWQKVDDKERSVLRMQKQGLLKPGQGFSRSDALAQQYGMGSDEKGGQPRESTKKDSTKTESGVFDVLSDMWTLASDAFHSAKGSVSNLLSSVFGSGGEL